MKMYEFCFSPTGGTQKAADILTGALADQVVRVDLTDKKTDFGEITLTQEDVAVIAVPSYGGRVPAAAVERMAAVRGNGARAVLVCVYGNRAYEDTLAELQDTAKQAGFRVIGAVAAVAEHSIARQFAAPRTFDEKGWLRIGFAGSQINMSETYINTGSVYLCTFGFLALGLPATDPFWTEPFTPWTGLKAWNGEDVMADHAIGD